MKMLLQLLLAYFIVQISECRVQENVMEDVMQDTYLINNHAQDQNMNRVVPSRRRTIAIMFAAPPDNNTCIAPDNDFPPFFSDEQLKKGAIAVSFLIGIYCFTLLAVVCDNYFLPCVKTICAALNLSEDVAAATFMAMATSAPEFFVNIIGTFVTESDIGIGTVMGSSMFNTLGVGALGSLFASGPIQLEWWPVSRDCVLYIISVSALVGVTWDGIVYWYEATILVVMYVFYFVVLFNNKRMLRLVNKIVDNHIQKKTSSTVNLTKFDINGILDENIEKGSYIEGPRSSISSTELSVNKSSEEEHVTIICDDEKPDTCASKLFTFPKDGGCFSKILFIYTWPIRFLLYWIIPNPKTNSRFFPITFIMCIGIIGGNSYIISWMITLIGNTFHIPSVIMGLTFLAAGGCLPEATSIFITARNGDGGIGVSNALGGNTMNILLTLGFPWFIKTVCFIGVGPKSFIAITAGSIEYTILGLLFVTVALYVTLYFNKFRFVLKTGIILTVIYVLFLSAAVAVEVLLFDRPSC